MTNSLISNRDSRANLEKNVLCAMNKLN